VRLLADSFEQLEDGTLDEARVELTGDGGLHSRKVVAHGLQPVTGAGQIARSQCTVTLTAPAMTACGASTMST
jgi:hypothetical protein